jgi:hypothetical protein
MPAGKPKNKKRICATTAAVAAFGEEGRLIKRAGFFACDLKILNFNLYALWHYTRSIECTI